MILKMELPNTKQIEHIENMLLEIKKGFFQGTFEGCKYAITEYDELDDENEKLVERNSYLKDQLQSIKENLEFKNTLREKVKTIQEIIEETEF